MPSSRPSIHLPFQAIKWFRWRKHLDILLDLVCGGDVWNKDRMTGPAQQPSAKEQPQQSNEAAEAAGPQHDPNDVVAQVLNYSNFGNDDGSPYGAFWYRVDECRYKLSFQGQATGREIDLNALDPKNIAFEPVGERAQGYSIIEPGVNILYKGNVLMHGVSTRCADTDFSVGCFSSTEITPSAFGSSLRSSRKFKGPRPHNLRYNRLPSQRIPRLRNANTEMFGKRPRKSDGTHEPHSSPLVLSDLEQTKGYEFNLSVIVNCSKNVIPPEDAPKEEAFRHGSRLYVAMTRARDELYISYHREPSVWLLSNARDVLSFGCWSDVVADPDEFIVPAPERLISAEEGRTVDVLNGRQFNYTEWALGLSTEALVKIDELVDGRGLSRDGRRIKWATMREAAIDLENSPLAKRLFGLVVQNEVRERLASVMATQAPK